MNNVMRTVLWAFCLLLCSASALAAGDKVYKTLDANGRVVYSQSPPPASKGASTDAVMEFSHLPASPLSAETLKFRADMEKSLAAKATAGYAPPANSVAVLFSAKWCGYCKLAKAYLQKGGYAYQELDIDTPEGMRSFVQVQPKSGIPVLLKEGKRINGFSAPAYDKFFTAGK
jgi:glutaredoxin